MSFKTKLANVLKYAHINNNKGNEYIHTFTLSFNAAN